MEISLQGIRWAIMLDNKIEDLIDFQFTANTNFFQQP